MGKTVTRIAPSPTGYMHIGTLRIALYNYLFAKKHGGKFLMRIEDTDVKRNVKEYDDDLIEQFRWSGIAPEKAVRQSDRNKEHVAAIQKLIKNDRAYISKEPAKDDPSRQVEVVRLRNAGKVLSFHDMLRGDISFDTAELKDFVIARTPESPLYHLAVVVDDADMEITHVIRGEDHISNTPRQILIQEALGLPRPEYAHIPLNLSADRSKLSKRKGDVSVKAYREQGFLPQALLNYLALLGWTPKGGREILSLAEMIGEFDLCDMHRSASIFDIEKLRWVNRQYLLSMPEGEFASEAIRALKDELAAQQIAFDADRLTQLIPVIRERISVWEDVREMLRSGELEYFFREPHLDVAVLTKDSSREEAAEHLSWLRERVEDAGDEISTDAARLKDMIWDYATEKGRGAVLWPFRYALTGKERSPDPFSVAAVLGKKEVLRRLDAALAALAS